MKRLYEQWQTHRANKFARRLAKTVFVRVFNENITENETEEKLREASERCGNVVQTRVEKNSLGRVGYVEFAEDGDATKACNLLAKQLMQDGLAGKYLKVTRVDASTCSIS